MRPRNNQPERACRRRVTIGASPWNLNASLGKGDEPREPRLAAEGDRETGFIRHEVMRLQGLGGSIVNFSVWP